MWIHFPYCCLTNQEAGLSLLCHIQGSNIPHLLLLEQQTQLLNLLILPSVMFSICPTPAPGHYRIGLLLGHSAFSFLFPGQAKSSSFTKLKYSYNIIRAWQRLPSSTVPCLTSIQLMPHKPSLAILYCSFHRSHPISPIPCRVSGFNATALSCSKWGKELIYILVGTSQSESTVGKLEQR